MHYYTFLFVYLKFSLAKHNWIKLIRLFTFFDSVATWAAEVNAKKTAVRMNAPYGSTEVRYGAICLSRSHARSADADRLLLSKSKSQFHKSDGKKILKTIDYE